MKKIILEDAQEESNTKPKESNEKRKTAKMRLKSLLQINLKNLGLRDALLKIGRLSPLFSLINVFQD